MAQIERRQACLRKMRSKLGKPKNPAIHDSVALDPQSHHHIGKSENEPEHIGTFLKMHQGDPAIMVQLSSVSTFLLYI